MLTARALILDVGHRVLTLKAPDDTWHTPGTIARVGERPLVALREFARERLGVDLGEPCGGSLTDFVFVLPPGAHVDTSDQAATRWVPLRAIDSVADADALFALYVGALLGGWEPPVRTLDVFQFGAEPRQAALLAHLVAKGRKRATCAWLDAERAKGNEIPAPGLVSVVTDGFGFPVCVVRTERVDEVRFADVDESVAVDGGEGDGTLDDWREGYRRAMEREAKEHGLAFGEDAVMVVERFRVLKVLGTTP